MNKKLSPQARPARKPKLALERETVRKLDHNDLSFIVGGMVPSLMATHGAKCTE